MKKYLTLIFLTILILNIIPASAEKIPAHAKKLIRHYKERISGFDDNHIVFTDGSRMKWDDGIENKTYQQLLDEPDLEDMFHDKYRKRKAKIPLPVNYDPGRIRVEPFFLKLYGESADKVRENLREIVWCPKLVGQKIRVSTRYGADKQFEKISRELDKHSELAPYLTKIAGTFNWRKIAGTDRLSMHSFGVTMDINTKFSHYWQWDCKCKNEDAVLGYHNDIPLKIVRTFEKHGFVWGGKWYHYDTMHFEYRPELM